MTPWFKQYRRPFVLILVSCSWCLPSQAADLATLQVVDDISSGQFVIVEGGQPVLQYNYRTVDPPEGYVEKVHSDARRYARSRSNYIHPLYGPHGEVLTADWSNDHPHHRGIYWAWPEVQYQRQLGDLHALQRVFARPTGNIKTRHGTDMAEIKAENQWMWEDKTPIVRELATIRAWKTHQRARRVDLRLEFTALDSDVVIARRGTNEYGGLNVRLAPVSELKLMHYADPSAAVPRLAWQAATGIWNDSVISFAVFEHADNPHYPGDYVQYAELPWFQPTFPQAGTGYTLKQGEPLVLQYRLWVCGGRASEEDYRVEWRAFQRTHR